MGIFKAAIDTIGGTLADQWLETIEPARIDNTVLSTFGVSASRNDSRGSNTKGTPGVISNGSIIHVPANTFMLLVDGGKIIAATDEAGYYQVDNSRSPSMFFTSSEKAKTEGYNNTGNGKILRPGGFKNTLMESWERFKFGGTSPSRQHVIYINKQEIPNIRFGTRNPVPYTDRVLVPGRAISCKVTSYGTYSIKIVDPMLFFSEVCDKSASQIMTLESLGEQYLNEFLSAYTTSLAKLSLENIMVNDIPIRTDALGKYMAEVLDSEWLSKRGFLIQSVGIASISLDEQTEKLLERYNNDSLLLDPNARAARMTGGISAGLESAGSNGAGAMMGFTGMVMGMNTAGAMGTMPNQQYQANSYNAQEAVNTWTCSCGNKIHNTALFCSKCGKKKDDTSLENDNSSWKCKCNNIVKDGLFCSMCGTKKPESKEWVCKCGNKTEANFCSNCGNKRNEQNEQEEAKNEPAKYKCDKCGWRPLIATKPPKICPRCNDAFGDEDKE